jgi:endoglucanase
MKLSRVGQGRLRGVWATACFVVILLLISSIASRAQSIFQYTGVNITGAELGTNYPGSYNIDYSYPDPDEVMYFQSKGMNTVRFAFRWERLQPTAYGPFDDGESARLGYVVQRVTDLGMYIIIEPHNFARYYPDPANYQSSPQGLIGTQVSFCAFGDFWERLALQFRSNDHVFFNLMNEPNGMPTEQWVTAANIAISQIRTAGATNLILVPGNFWTSAWFWNNNGYGTPNSVAMLNITDPANNYAFEVHQYLDSKGAGITPDISSPTVGVDRLTYFTQWLRTNHFRGFLGEFAASNDLFPGIGADAVSNMLSYVVSNGDVWLGWTWWTAGPNLGNYMFTAEPNGSIDRPCMSVLTNFTSIPTVTTTDGLHIWLDPAGLIYIQTKPGYVYLIESTLSLDEPWTPFFGWIHGNGDLIWDNIDMTYYSERYFRVRIEPDDGQYVRSPTWVEP